MTSASKWRGRHTTADADAASLPALGVGGGCCLSAPLLAQLFTISCCRSLFSGLFFGLRYFAPHCAGSRGE
ncbi:hypothetical protein [Rhizobium bangladeshense]|uniref:hypothetical protein n=1 Tax=Rhizobium bangladeshense TaxID=1138189 RepID=UPI0007E53E6F|nr:hypothetical protein [Rhizobium bangladeshense]